MIALPNASSFTAPGTGAVARNVSDLLAERNSAGNFGVVGDGQANRTGAITSGSAILVVGSSVFSSAADVGKTIWVAGAGATGGTLSTTILSVQSGTHVTLAANAQATVTNASVAWGTDDTAAIQAAIAAPSSLDSADIVVSSLLPRRKQGYIVSAPIVLNTGQSLVGDSHLDSAHGVTLIARPGFSGAAVIKTKTWDVGASWWDAGLIENLVIDCNNVAAAGVAVHQMGEEALINRVRVYRATDSGFLMTGVHAPATIKDSTAFNCTNYGFKFTTHPTFTSDGAGGMVRAEFSGDNNGISVSNGAHVYLDGGHRGFFHGVKSEGHKIFMLIAGSATGGGAAVIFLNAFANATSGDDFVKIIGTSTPILCIQASVANGYTNYVNDTTGTPGAYVVPLSMLPFLPNAFMYRGAYFQAANYIMANGNAVSAINIGGTVIEILKVDTGNETRTFFGGAVGWSVNFQDPSTGANTRIMRVRRAADGGCSFLTQLSLQAASAKTSSYTAAGETIVPVDTSGGGVTITLPTAAAVAGLIYTVNKVTGDTNTLTVIPTGVETINGGSSVSNAAPYAALNFFSNGTAWFRLTTGAAGDVTPLNITFDGGGSVVTTSNSTVSTTVPFDADIVGWDLIADDGNSGNLTVEVEKATYANWPSTASIAASAKPSLSSAAKNTDSTLSGWTTLVTTGDRLKFYLSGTPTVITKATLTLKLRRRK